MAAIIFTAHPCQHAFTPQGDQSRNSEPTLAPVASQNSLWCVLPEARIELKVFLGDAFTLCNRHVTDKTLFHA
jgi:hypothetical protein